MATGKRTPRAAAGAAHGASCAQGKSAVAQRRGAVRCRAAAAGMRGAVRCRAAAAGMRGGCSAAGLRVALVAARFNDLVTGRLLDGAEEALLRFGASPDDLTTVWVPGSFELPVVAKSMAKSGSFDAVVCIGAVVRGDTTHYDEVAGGARSGILSASADTGVPCVFGVLTCETMEQALDRAGGKAGNKGEEAAMTAIEMANLMRALEEKGIGVAPWH